MKKIAQILIAVVFALIISVNVVLAASLAVTSIGGVAVTGTLTSFTTTKTSPTMIGTATNDATVDIKIDDLTVAVTADADGDWSYTPTSLTVTSHAVEITSNLETVSFTLVIDDGTTTTSTTSTTTTKGGTSTTSGELPQAGSATNTFLIVTAGMFLIGTGIVAHQVLPTSKTE
ncbi:MAG TPA: hypothetical protein VGA89_02450 [Patescibacteria group bacterium]|jgi:hypothetical protein